MHPNRNRASLLAALLCLSLVAASAVTLAAEGNKVDLNRASAEELQTLPGIGPALAERIIEYREKNGPFQRVEDLMNVRGIGEKNFLKLRDLVTVEPDGGGKG